MTAHDWGWFFTGIGLYSLLLLIVLGLGRLADDGRTKRPAPPRPRQPRYTPPDPEFVPWTRASDDEDWRAGRIHRAYARGRV